MQPIARQKPVKQSSGKNLRDLINSSSTISASDF